MNTSYLPSFIRDLKALKKTPIYNTIKAIAFEEIPKYDSSAQISNLKKLKGNDSAYRIRVGDSTLGVWFMLKDTVTLKPLADCQKPHSRLFQSCAIKNKPCILLPKTSEVLKTSEVYNLAWKDATVRQNCFGGDRFPSGNSSRGDRDTQHRMPQHIGCLAGSATLTNLLQLPAFPFFKDRMRSPDSKI